MEDTILCKFCHGEIKSVCESCYESQLLINEVLINELKKLRKRQHLFKSEPQTICMSCGGQGKQYCKEKEDSYICTNCSCVWFYCHGKVWWSAWNTAGPDCQCIIPTSKKE